MQRLPRPGETRCRGRGRRGSLRFSQVFPSFPLEEARAEWQGRSHILEIQNQSGCHSRKFRNQRAPEGASVLGAECSPSLPHSSPWV